MARLNRGFVITIAVAISPIVLGFVLNFLILAITSAGKPNGKEIERELQRELPIGSSTAQVEAWFQRKGLEYGYIDKNRSIEGRSYYGATIQDAGRDLFTEIVISIKIYISDQNHVEQVAVETAHIGL